MLKSSQAGKVRNVSLPIPIGATADAYRRILDTCEGTHGDKKDWSAFLLQLKERGALRWSI